MARLSRLIAAVFCAALPAAAAERPPNVVFILTDDLGWSDLGSYGNARIRTPHTDRLAKTGTRFTNFYAAAPICSPSRAGLLTGQAPERVGVTAVLFPEAKKGLPAGVDTLGDVLRRRGYATGLIGKWHLGAETAALPVRHGFDRFFGFPYSNDMAPFLVIDQEREVERYATPAAAKAVMPSLTSRLTKAAVQFIEASGDRPFFLLLAHAMPHGPVAASAAFEGRSKLGRRGDAIEELDWSVGEIDAALARTGHERDTLLVFTSDNGGVGRNLPLRGGKFAYFEGGLRVPMLVRWPGHVPAGRTADGPATLLDWMPTLAALTGAAPPAQPQDGRDISDLLLGRAALPDVPLVFWKGAVREGRWKLVTDKRLGTFLFDLQSDPGETTDVAAAHADVMRRLQDARVRAAAARELGPLGGARR